MNAPGSPFVGVADDVLGEILRAPGELPLQAGEEAGAAAAAQPGVFHLAHHVLGRHLVQHLAQRSVTVAGDVLVDAFRVDEAAVAEGDADLFAVEGDVVVQRQGLVLDRLLVGQAFDRAALEQRLLDHLGDVARLHLAVEDALGVDHHDRPHGAEAAAAGGHYAHFVGQAAPSDLALHGCHHLVRIRRMASRPAADQHFGAEAFDIRCLFVVQSFNHQDGP